MKYRITLKSGVIVIMTGKDGTKNLIGLWIYLMRKVSPEVIDFIEGAILVSEIAMMERE